MHFKPIMMLRCLAHVFMIFAFWAASLGATNIYIDPAGSDTNNCLSPGTACQTLQHANDVASPGDTIIAAAGLYSFTGLVNINKTLTIQGANSGNCATGPRGAESILSNTQGISVSASGVTFDGFTIRDSSAAVTGFGLWLNPGVDGSTIINNIFTNNIAGLGISNLGGTQGLVQCNYFHDNNLPGGRSGTGIYTDQSVSGAVSKVLITENSFQFNNNAGIAFNSIDTANPDTFITISNNLINANGRGIYFFNTQSSSVTGNQITNSTLPTDGGSSTGIGIFGAVNGLTITNNNIENGAQYGIRIIDFITPNNTNLDIHLNNIDGNATAGMHVDNMPDAPIDYATCNWWGDASGPFNALFNPHGTGDVIEGAVVGANFIPWLTALAPEGPCNGFPPLSLAKSFSPSTITQDEDSTLTIILINPTNTPAVMTAPLVDNLPPGVEVSGPSSNTCGGVVTAINGSGTVTLTGGTIPASGSCSVTATVTTFSPGVFVNTIPAGALQTTNGSNLDPASATLTSLCPQPPCPPFATADEVSSCLLP